MIIKMWIRIILYRIKVQISLVFDSKSINGSGVLQVKNRIKNKDINGLFVIN